MAGIKTGEVYVEIGAVMDAFNKAMNKAQKEISQLDRQFKTASKNIKQSFQNIENSAKVWGRAVDVNALKQDVLRKKINTLIAQGVNPASKRIKVLKKEFDSLEKKTKSTAKGFANFAKIAYATVGAIIVSGLKKSVSAASDLEEQVDKAKVVFSELKEESKAVAKDLQENFGLSERAAVEMLAATGNLAKGLNFTQKEALDLSETINKAAVNITSFTNFAGGTTRASQILTRALLGEREALASLDIKISELDLKQRALAKGIQLVNGQIPRQAKALLTLELIQERTVDSTDNFQKTINSWANQSRIAEGVAEDLAATFGKGLLPAVTDATKGFTENAEALSLVAEGLGVATGAVIKYGLALAEGIPGLSLIITQMKMIGALKRMEADAKRDPFALEGEIGKRQFEEAKREAEGIKQKIKAIKKISSAGKSATDERKSLLDEFLKKYADIGKSQEEIIKSLALKELHFIQELEQKKIITIQESADAQIAVTEKMQANIEKLKQVSTQKQIQTGLFLVNQTGNILQQLSQLYQMHTQNLLANLDYQRQERLDRNQEDLDLALEQEGLTEETDVMKAEKEIADLESQFNRTRSARERAEIRKQIDEKKRETKRMKIVQEFKEKEAKINEEADAKKRKLEREAAIRQKAFNTYMTLLEIPTTAFAAYASAFIPKTPYSPILGAILAGIATTLGLAKLAMIRATPLPPAKEGIYAETPYIGGEAGPELAFPLSSSQGRNAIGLLAEGIMNNIEARATVADEDEGGGMMHVVVNLGSKVLYDDISQATVNREVIVDAGAVV